MTLVFSEMLLMINGKLGRALKILGHFRLVCVRFDKNLVLFYGISHRLGRPGLEVKIVSNVTFLGSWNFCMWRLILWKIFVSCRIVIIFSVPIYLIGDNVGRKTRM